MAGNKQLEKCHNDGIFREGHRAKHCGNTEMGQPPTRWTGRGPKSQEPSSKVPSKGRGRRELERYSVGQTWEGNTVLISHLSRCGVLLWEWLPAPVFGKIWQCLLAMLWAPAGVEGIYESVCQWGYGHRNACVCANVLWYVNVCVYDVV